MDRRMFVTGLAGLVGAGVIGAVRGQAEEPKPDCVMTPTGETFKATRKELEAAGYEGAAVIDLDEYRFVPKGYKYGQVYLRPNCASLLVCFN